LKRFEKFFISCVRVIFVMVVAISNGSLAVAKSRKTEANYQANATDVAKSERKQALRNVKSWGYQLQKLDLAQLSASAFDLLVVDHAPDRAESVEQMFRSVEVDRLKMKPDGSRRIALAYVSIGEAERYRFYWDETWVSQATCPSWLGPVNPQWAGNYPVEFWQPQWQALIFGSSTSYVDRVLAAGFDGIYLDRADVYDQFKTRPSAQADMEAFVVNLTTYARTITPTAIVVLQNAEELLRNKRVLSALDGVAKESLYFNADQASTPNTPSELAASLADLRRAKQAGVKVMLVEYLDEADKARLARKQAVEDGFLIHFTERSLSTLNLEGSERPALGSAHKVSAGQTVAGDTQGIRSSPCG
jgi:cysteinyl-tRNA synthetase, unknown class